MNRVSDNDNLGNAVMIIIYVHMWYRYNNVVFDAGICNNDGSREKVWWLNDHVIKLLSTGFITILFAM